MPLSLLDRLGRKPLLVGSFLGMAATMLLMAAALALPALAPLAPLISVVGTVRHTPSHPCPPSHASTSPNPSRLTTDPDPNPDPDPDPNPDPNPDLNPKPEPSPDPKQVLYISSFALGVGPIPAIMTGELLCRTHARHGRLEPLKRLVGRGWPEPGAA